MNLTFSASGSPKVVLQSVMQQAKSARASSPDSGALIMAARDDVARMVNAAPVDATVSVSSSISISVTVTPKPEAPAAPVLVDKAAEKVA